MLVALAAFFAPGPQPAQAQTTVWSATLTVGDLVGTGTLLGCENPLTGLSCSLTSILTDDDFTYDGVEFEVEKVSLSSSGYLSLLLNKAIPANLKAALTLNVDGTPLSLAGATLSSGDKQANWASTGLSWSVGGTVSLSLTEGSASSDATLSSLTGTPCTNGVTCSGTLTLSPAFDPFTTSYTATVANSINHATLTPTANHASATIEVGKGGSLAPVTSGSASTAIALDVGANTITVRVTAADSSTRDYYVVITRRGTTTDDPGTTFPTLQRLPVDDSITPVPASQRAPTGAGASASDAYCYLAEGNGTTEYIRYPDGRIVETTKASTAIRSMFAC